MPTDIRVPTTGNAGEDAVVVEWNFAVGDAVNAGDVLVVLETAKSTIDVEVPVSGHVLRLMYDVGDEAPEHQVLAVLGAEGEVLADESPAIDSPAAEQYQPPATAASTPVASASVPAADAQHSTAIATKSGRHAASPRARIIAERRGIDLATLTGSGPGGRIIVGDVIAAATSVPAEPSVEAVQSPSVSPTSVPAFVDVPVRGARKVTAQRMHASLQATAQLTLTRYAGADAIFDYAKRLRAITETQGLPKIGVNDLLLFATARAVKRHPAANSWFEWDSIRQFSVVNLGFAVDTTQALLVPVIRDADRLTLAELAASSRSLIEAARSGKLGSTQMEGGTFTVSNLGGLGVHWFTPVLNPPQSCILGVGAMHQLHPLGPQLLPLSLTFDHRSLDGAAAATLLADIVSAIETIDTLSAF
jgi:pyruvate dehydrogenase E2 component (dihydrolipoamide acetyltransferase)